MAGTRNLRVRKVLEKYTSLDSNQSPKTREKVGVSEVEFSNSFQNLKNDPQLAEFLQLWPTLTDEQIDAIMGIVTGQKVRQ